MRTPNRRSWGTIITRTGKPGFYARFTWEGSRYSRAAGPTKGVAAQKLSQAHAALAGGKDIALVLAEVFGDEAAHPLTFAKAWESYKDYAKPRKRESTFDSDVCRMGPILKTDWAGKRLAAIKGRDLQAWADARRAAGASGPTINRDFAVVSAVFTWARRRGYVRESPCPQVERESERGRGREVYLTADESRMLLDVASPIAHPVILCALSTGMRTGELLALRWRDVDLRRREITIQAETSKGGRTHAVPMTADLFAVLEQRHEDRPKPALDASDPVFCLNDGEAITYSHLRCMWKSAKRAARDLPPAKRSVLRFHDLRHTAASLMVASGVSIFDVSKILGHATITMTMRYAHFAPDNARASVERFGAAAALAPLQPAEAHG